MLQFGPMRFYNTLRQERTHQIYKDLARKCKKYTEFSKFAAMKALLRQCFQMQQNKFTPKITYEGVETSNEDIRNLLPGCCLIETSKINYQSVIYTINHYIIVSRLFNFTYEAVRIHSIFIDKNENDAKKSIFFYGYQCQLQYEGSGILKKLHSENETLSLVNFTQLLDYYPLIINFKDEESQEYLLKKHEFLLI